MVIRFGGSDNLDDGLLPMIETADAVLESAAVAKLCVLALIAVAGSTEGWDNGIVLIGGCSSGCGVEGGTGSGRRDRALRTVVFRRRYRAFSFFALCFKVNTRRSKA